MVGKIDEKSDNFDVIVFAICDIKSATISPNIKTDRSLFILRKQSWKCWNLIKFDPYL